MNQHNNQSEVREREIFLQALEKTSMREREAFVETACAGDDRLRAAVNALLSNTSAPLLDRVAEAARSSLDISSSEQPGDTIGRYKLLEKLGEGGFGAVYMAEQREPVKRRIALKIIKAGMDTREVVARFEAERQALALMDHPNIARVFDAGATENGRPFFVLELVRGIKITEYCERNKLDLNARLKLFIQVCQAVQHAHQKGIIHRDLKPSNILVTLHDGVPVPKVIDFGIAKATQQELTEKTVFTRFHQFIGTPAYMSPEQAELSGLDIDTRSDIYSLGVLLYELLTGQTPFDGEQLLKAGLDEMRRIIREQEPVRPSTRVSTLNRNRSTSPALSSHHSSLATDLDWIVMKCLEKDRARRYETANGLAAEIQRHLNNEPVVACPPSNLYRFQKLVRRNKLVFTAGASVVAALIIGLGIATWMFVRERAAVREQSRLRQMAQAETAKNQEVAQFLKEMLKGLGPSVAWGGDRTLLQEMLKQTAERIGQGLTNQPDVAISLRLSLAETYEELGLYEPEAEIAEQALLFAQSTLGTKSLPAANSLTQLGWAEWRLNKLDQAEQHMREGLALRRELLGSEHALVADSLEKLSFVLSNQKKPAESEAAAREALGLRQRLLGDHPDVARSLATLATVLRMTDRYDEAEPYAREAVTLHRKLLGNGHYDTTTALNKLAMVLMGQRKFSEAEDLMRESLATQRKLLGDKHPELVLSLGLLGQILSDRKPAEAEAMYREALAMQRKLHGDEHPDVAVSLNNLANTLFDQGKLAEAETLHREALAMRKNLLGDEDPNVAVSLHNLALVFSRQGKRAESEAMHREALSMRKRLLGNEHPDVAESLDIVASVLFNQGKLAEAEVMCRQVLTMQKKLLGDEHAELVRAHKNLVLVLSRQSKLAEAETMQRQALIMQKKLLGDEHEDTVAVMRGLAELRALQGQFAEAAGDFRQLIDRQLNDTKADNHEDWHKLAALLVATGQLDIYRERCRKSVERFGNSADPSTAERIAKDCLILPDSGADLAVVAKMADRAAAVTNHWATPWFQFVKGLAEYRQGNFASAVEWMNKTLTETGKELERDVEAYMVLAMARYQLNEIEAARSALASGLEIEQTKLPKLENRDLGSGWLDWIIAHALMREAKVLVEADTKSKVASEKGISTTQEVRP